MIYSKKTTLGRTGLPVGRLGISSSFGAPATAFEEAFERGCNYFTWGTFIKGRSGTIPYLNGRDRPGVVSFTATDWQKLLKPKKMPPGESPLTAAECYRFALSNATVDVCMMGAKTVEQMRENLAVLEKGPLTEKELHRVQFIGEHVYGK
jgi:aryl-alcohol dehydrogenase-like predicted oxidoreductase